MKNLHKSGIYFRRLLCLFVIFADKIIFLSRRRPLQIFAEDYLLPKSTTKSHLTLLREESVGRGNKAMIIPLDFTVSVSGQQQLLLPSPPDTFSRCKNGFSTPPGILPPAAELLSRHLKPDAHF